MANTSLVLLPGVYASHSDRGPLFPPTRFFALTAYDKNSSNNNHPIIDCSGSRISLPFQHISFVRMYNCVAFIIGQGTSNVVEHSEFNDVLMRLGSTAVNDSSGFSFTSTHRSGSKSYCQLQKHLADNTSTTSRYSKLILKNVVFSSEYHPACSRNYGIQLTTISVFENSLDIADCRFSGNDINQVSVHGGSLQTSGVVHFEDANTAVEVINTSIILAGTVSFTNNKNSAIRVTDMDSTITLTGTLKFINNSAYQGGAIYSTGNVTAVKNAQVVFEGNYAASGGGAIYGKNQHIILAGTVRFIKNSANFGGAVMTQNGSVTVTRTASVVFDSNHANGGGGAIDDHSHSINLAGTVKFINNSARFGGAIATLNGSITATKTADVVFESNYAISEGGAIADYNQHNIILQGTVKFIANSAKFGGAIGTHNGSVMVTKTAQVVFQDNYADGTGGAIDGHEQYVTIAGTVKFVNNTSGVSGGAIGSSGCITIKDSAQVVFQGNYGGYSGGAIITYRDLQATDHSDAAQVILKGRVQFINNSATFGGGIYISNAEVITTDYARVVFRGNHADHIGGAIFSTGRDIVWFLLYTFPVPFCRITFGENSKMKFIDNTAKSGGSAIYGVTTSKMVCNNVTAYDYHHLFDMVTIVPDYSSAISSDPLRVCICPDQSTPDCLAILPDQNIPHLHYTVYPGQNFTIPAAVVGFNFALTSGSIYSQFLNSDAVLSSEYQYVQGASHKGCTQLQYAVRSAKKHETLVLTIDGRRTTGISNQLMCKSIEVQNDNVENLFHSYYPNPAKYYADNAFATNLTDGVFRLAGYVDRDLQDTPIFISLTLLDCPLGFTLTGKPHRCMCNDKVTQNLLSCNITDQTIRRHTNIWVNASFNGNTSNGVIIHRHCPFEYCRQEQLDVNLTKPETQCAYDRYGTLCGACKPGLSLALGSSQCLEDCSNKYLSLLIAFASAGFALVFFIKILNLTVSQGTVNGLIFYANIVAANRSIFFPAHYSKFMSFLSVFISWLNLDLGIETCFIKGLDGYWKTWLQFLFPFYIWAIAGTIVLVSHYSTRATSILGNNSVSVLATLFLLSYAKFIRSVIAIFSFATLEHPNNITSTVWAFDGNIQYFSPKHIPLFQFALIIFLLLWLPYTVVLLSAQWLRTQTHRKGLKWLKPFLDAYYGPFKDNHHYWVGVLLVVRGVLFVLFASFFAIENNVNLLLISVSSVSLAIYMSVTGMLHKIYLTAFETTFFLNLGVLAVGTLYIRLVGGSQEALVTTSVGIAFLQFFALTIFHSFYFIFLPIRTWYVKSRTAYTSRAITNATELEPLLRCNSSESDDEYIRPTVIATHSEVCLSELREQAAQQRSEPDDGAASEAIAAPRKSEATAATALTLGVPSTTQESESVRYFAATRDEHFIDSVAPRESLLEYTQYHLPQEGRRYVTHEREESIDFTATREPLLEPATTDLRR